MRCTKCLLAILGIGCGLLILGEMASADPGTVPPGQLPTLTGEWWQWAYSFPNSQNPLNDATGERCMFGQRGLIWFLAGNQTAPRACSVPEGATLFFPLINAVNFSTPGECGNTTPLNLKQLRASVAAFIDPVPVQDLFASVDGQPVKKNLIRRVQSEPFAVALPADNLCDFGPPPNPPSFVAPGIYAPAVDDGYYVSLGPLTPGQHHIKFGSTFKDFFQDNTYNLTVVPVSLK
jgi:hypothetical protein